MCGRMRTSTSYSRKISGMFIGYVCINNYDGPAITYASSTHD